MSRSSKPLPQHSRLLVNTSRSPSPPRVPERQTPFNGIGAIFTPYYAQNTDPPRDLHHLKPPSTATESELTSSKSTKPRATPSRSDKLKTPQPSHHQPPHKPHQHSQNHKPVSRPWQETERCAGPKMTEASPVERWGRENARDQAWNPVVSVRIDTDRVGSWRGGKAGAGKTDRSMNAEKGSSP